MQSRFDGVSMRYSIDDGVGAVGPPDPVLLDARLAGDLARRLEGRHHPSHAQRLGPLQRRHLGAVPHRHRPRRAARPGRRAPGQAPRAGQPVVRRGRRERGVPARRPVRAGDHHHAAAAAGRAPYRYVYFPDTAEVPEAQAVNIRNRSFAIGALVDIPAPGAQGVLFATGRGSAATPCTSRTTGCTTSTTSSAWSSRRSTGPRTCRPGENLILSASFDKDGEEPPRGRHRDPVALPRRPQGRRGPDQDPARAVRARRRGPVRRPGQRRGRHRRLPDGSPYRSPAAPSTGSPSTSAATRTSTLSARPRPCWPASRSRRRRTIPTEPRAGPLPVRASSYRGAGDHERRNSRRAISPNGTIR